MTWIELVDSLHREIAAAVNTASIDLQRAADDINPDEHPEAERAVDTAYTALIGALAEVDRICWRATLDDPEHRPAVPGTGWRADVLAGLAS